MKKILFSCLVFIAVACGTPKDTFVIEGYVPSLSDSTMLILLPFGTQRLSRVDTAYVLNGRFSFDYPTTGKGKVRLMSREDIPTGTHLPIWVEPGKKATITGDNNLIYTWTVESSIPEQQEANRYKQASKKDLEELQQIRIESVKLMSAGNSDEIRKQEQEFLKQYNQIQYRIYDRTLDLLAKAEPSVIFLEELSGIAMIIQHYEAYAALKGRAIEQYERLPEEMKNTPEGKKIRVGLFPPAKVNTGDRMADTEMVDLEGKTHHLSDYLGKYILLDFWAFWCGPCLQAMPELGEIAEKYGDKLTIVGICSDPKEQWAKVTEEYNITWVNLNAAADPEFNARYGIDGFPYQFVISPEGIILGSWFGYSKGHIKKQLKNYIPDLE